MPDASAVSGQQSQVVPNSLVPHSYSQKLADHQPFNTRVSRGREGAGAIVSLWDFFLMKRGLQEQGSQRSDYFWSQWVTWEDLIFTSICVLFPTPQKQFVEVLPLLNNRGLCLENKMFWNMIMCVYILPDCILPWEQWKCHFYLTELFAFRLETVHQAVPPPSPNLLGFFVFLVSGNLRARMIAPLTASGWGLAVN